MRRTLLRSPSFVRAARRLLKKHPKTTEALRTFLPILEQDAYDPRLKTHKLKGDLDRYWSCVLGYDLRIVFQFVSHEGNEAILLHTIGTHDEVY